MPTTGPDSRVAGAQESIVDSGASDIFEPKMNSTHTQPEKLVS